MSESMFFEISIIIPTNRLDENLIICLNSLENCLMDNLVEIIVVLDGVKNSPEFFSSFVGISPVVIELKRNSGPAYARNKGAEYATGEILFFLDSDVSVHADTLPKVIQHFALKPSRHVLIGSYDDIPLEPSVVSRFRNLLHHHTHQNSRAFISTFWGACGAIRRDVFFELNGFDPSFKKPSIEDIELGYRLTKAGYQIELKKDLFVTHLKRWSFVNMIKTDIFLRAKPWTKELHKHNKISEYNLNVNTQEKFAAILVCLGMLCLVLSILNPWFYISSFFTFAFLIYTKRETYIFFRRYFSFISMPLVVLLHWCYLLSASVGFLLGIIEYRFADTSR